MKFGVWILLLWITWQKNNGVKYLLVHQDAFHRRIDKNGMKAKASKETIFTKKNNRPVKSWVDKGTEFAGQFKIFCNAQGIHIYSTKNETKAPFAERTK